MTPFRFLHSTHEIVVGAGVLGRLEALAKQHRATKAAVVLDGFFRGGLLEQRVHDLLRAGTGAEPDFWAMPTHEPFAEDVEACRDFLGASGADLIVGVGGGSALDTVKVARMLLSNPGDISAIVGPVGVRMIPHTSLLIAVPTTAGTGSEVSESAVIGRHGASGKMIFRSEHMTPRIALLDPEPSASAPAGVTAASGYDAVTHAVEAFTSNLANGMTDMFAIEAMERLARFLPASFHAPDDLEARTECLVGSMQAAVAFNSANLGLAHAISGAMGALHHAPHGISNALALPWTMAFNRTAMGSKDAVVARIFGGATAGEGLSRLRHELGLDIGLDALIGADADLDAIAEAASRSGQIRMNPRLASVGDIRAILAAMRAPTGGLVPRLDL